MLYVWVMAMDYALFDKAQEQFDRLYDYTEKLKSENRELKRKISAVTVNLTKHSSDNAELKSLKRKHSAVIEERDRLTMERELLRKKVEKMIFSLDKAIDGAERAGNE